MHGRVPFRQVFGKESRAVVAQLNVEGQHRGAVAAVKVQQSTAAAAAAGGGHDHSHEEKPHSGAACTHEVAPPPFSGDRGPKD